VAFGATVVFGVVLLLGVVVAFGGTVFAWLGLTAFGATPRCGTGTASGIERAIGAVFDMPAVEPTPPAVRPRCATPRVLSTPNSIPQISNFFI